MLFDCPQSCSYLIQTMIHRWKRHTFTYFTSTSTKSSVREFYTPCVSSFTTTHHSDSHFHETCRRIANAHSLFNWIQSARDSEPFDVQEYLDVIKKSTFSNWPATSDDNRTTNIGSQLDTDMFAISIRSATQHICPSVVVWGQCVS
jgi:hypothetical protein